MTEDEIKALKTRVTTLTRERDEAVARYDKLHLAAGTLLREIRNDAFCILCDAPIGKPHAKSCASWPFIEERVEVATGEKPRLFV